MARRDTAATNSVAHFQQMRMAALTVSGRARDAAISPDGKYVAYVESDAGRQCLWVKHAATGSAVQIVAPAEVIYRGVTYSPDGNHVYFVTTNPGEPSFLYQVPALGGAPRKILADVDSAISFSPDGQRFVFIRHSNEDSALWVANEDGSQARRLASRSLKEQFLSITTGGPAWSPNGNSIACPAIVDDGKVTYLNVFDVQAESGEQRPITGRRWQWMWSAAWLSDGTGLVVAGRFKNSDMFQLWQLSYPGGEVRRITNDLSHYKSLSLAADSSSLVSIKNNEASNIKVGPTGDAGRARQITSGNGCSTPSWAPDGRLVCVSWGANGGLQVWMMEADGTNQKQLTVEGDNYRPAVTPDGRYVVFISTRADETNIWRMDIDGGNVKQLTSGNLSHSFLDFSPDSRWVVYSNPSPGGGGRSKLWKVSIDGGDSVQLTKDASSSRTPAVSPDGKLITCAYQDDADSTATSKVALIPFEGGEPIKTIDIPALKNSYDGFLRWSADGRALTYAEKRGEASNVWSQPVDGGTPRQHTSFKENEIVSFGWSRDGKQLAVVRWSQTSDVVMISDFK